MKFIILIVLWTSLLCISPTLESENTWDELENLLEGVDTVGERVITDNEHVDDADDDDESTLMQYSVPNESESNDGDKSTNLGRNPCHNHPCGWGKECTSKNDGKSKANCDCARRCPDIPTNNANDKVCSNRNQTFDSICHLYRERCLCKKNDQQCTDFSFGNLHLEYLGACKELQPCTTDHLQQFSERMVGWLFQVMKDMKKRQELHGEKWLHMLEEAEHDDHLKHVYPVVWKYCDLDRKPHDKAVTHHELIPIIAPVMPMESCIKPFLKSCDSNQDDLISLEEWGTCLGLSHDEITERC